MHASAKHSLPLLLLMVIGLLPRLDAQDVTAQLTPMEERVQVGRPFQVELRVRHPEELVVIFPDSVTDLAPYEVKTSRPLPTRTNEGISEDVKLYDLYTWEIDSLQYLQFPVRYLNAGGDTITVLSNRAEVEFQQVIAQYSDSLKVMLLPEAVNIREPFDWLAFGVLGGGGLIILVVLAIFLRKPILNAFRRRRIDREWSRYQQELARVQGLLPDEESYIAELNRIWRVYFDRDWKLALSSRTTKELTRFLPSVESISEGDRTTLLALSTSADMVLYARRSVPQERLVGFFGHISRIMEQEYRRRKEAIEV
ncbi:MAG: hypothetical protein AAGN35_03670 [Bacteroidota bacterium]